MGTGALWHSDPFKGAASPNLNFKNTVCVGQMHRPGPQPWCVGASSVPEPHRHSLRGRTWDCPRGRLLMLLVRVVTSVPLSLAGAPPAPVSSS